MTLYVALACAIAATKLPWCDEGWYANPAYNLAFRGEMGISVLEPSGSYLNAYLSGVQHRAYLTVPNHILELAAWFRIFGFGLFSARFCSILWGAVGLLALFYILCALFPNPHVAHLALFLTCLDFIFVWTAADTRAEAPANALALCALVVYLRFREKRFGAAILFSQVLLAVAVFTHPNALLVGLAIPVLTLWRDSKRIRARHLVIAAPPYLAIAGLWAIYILQSPSDFRAQFLANASGRNGTRWRDIFHPVNAISMEGARYVGAYWGRSLWAGEGNPLLLLVVFIYALAAGWLLLTWRHQQPGSRTFTVCLSTLLIGLTFLNGFKAPTYLHFAVPFYDAAVAVWLIMLWQRGRTAKGIALIAGCGFALLELATSFKHIRAEEIQRQYRPTIAVLKHERATGKSIMGTAALGFGLDFVGFSDDWRLGVYSSLAPDVIVLDRSYRQFLRDFEIQEPVVVARALRTLTTDYRLSTAFGSYWIFERVHGDGGPAIDTSGLTNGGRAELLFEHLCPTLASKNGERQHAQVSCTF